KFIKNIKSSAEDSTLSLTRTQMERGTEILLNNISASDLNIVAHEVSESPTVYSNMPSFYDIKINIDLETKMKLAKLLPASYTCCYDPTSDTYYTSTTRESILSEIEEYNEKYKAYPL